MSPSTVLALINLVAIAGWSVVRQENGSGSRLFALARLATILLSATAFVVAMFVSSSTLVTTGTLLLSVAANVGLSIWAFVNQTQASSAEKSRHR